MTNGESRWIDDPNDRAGRLEQAGAVLRHDFQEQLAALALHGDGQTGTGMHVVAPEPEPEELIDEEEAYAVARRYIDRQLQGFTVPELYAHLQKLGARTIRNVNDLYDIFENDWYYRLVADKKAADNPHTWLRPDVRRRHQVFLLSQIARPKSAAAPAPGEPLPVRHRTAALPEQPTAVKDSIDKAIETGPSEPDLSEEAYAYILQHPQYRIRRLTLQFAAEYEIDSETAQAIFDAHETAGRIFKVSTDGSVWYAPEPTLKPSKGDTAHTVGKKKAPELDDFQRKAAAQILRAMTGPYTYVTQPLTPKEIARNITDKTGNSLIDPDVISSLSRVLQQFGMIARVQARQGRKRAKARRLEVMKIKIKDRKTMAYLRTDSGMAAALRTIETGEPFFAPDVT